MAVKNIYIQKGRTGKLIPVLTETSGISAAVLSSGASEYGTVRLSADGPDAVLSAGGSSSIFREAVDRYVSDPENRYVARIAGVGPDSDGVLWIHGGPCSSWTLPEAGTVKTYGTVNRTTGKPIYNEEQGGGMVLYDTCPTCSSCDEVLELKRMVESCRIWLNLLKDVNLYSIESTAARRAYLESFSLPSTGPGLTGCSASQGAPEELDGVLAKSTQLFKQYAAMVHMWNYAVSQNNAAVEIHQTPEDPAGFYVTTKRAFPTCNTGSSITCSIHVQPNLVEPDLSMYIPDAEVSVMPFPVEPAAPLPTPAVSVAGPADKTVTVTFFDLQQANTYLVTAKFLPFRYVRLQLDGASQPISVQDYIDMMNYEDVVDPTPTQDGSQTIKLKVTPILEPPTMDNPTEDDYLGSKSYPSLTQSGVNSWSITLTWTLSGAVEKTFTETYFYETNRARIPMSADNSPLKNSIFVIPKTEQ